MVRNYTHNSNIGNNSTTSFYGMSSNFMKLRFLIVAIITLCFTFYIYSQNDNYNNELRYRHLEKHFVELFKDKAYLAKLMHKGKKDFQQETKPYFNDISEFDSNGLNRKKKMHSDGAYVTNLPLVQQYRSISPEEKFKLYKELNGLNEVSEQNNLQSDNKTIYDQREYIKFDYATECKLNKLEGAEIDNSVKTDFPNDPDTFYILAHSHTDLGWVSTVDKYYDDFVEKMMKSVIDSQYLHPHRKFLIGEVGFFKMWYDELEKNGNTKLLKKVKAVLETKQLEFANGSISMNDNATASFEDIIENYYYGHRYLNRKFGYIPKIGWSVDPFGHSSTMPILLNNMGYRGLVINRIPEMDKINRRLHQELDLFWKPTKKTSVLTHILAYHYNSFTLRIPPHGNPVRSLKRDAYENPLNERFVSTLVDDVFGLFSEFDRVKPFYRTNINFLPVGDDFTFSDANKTYSYIDSRLSMCKSNPKRFENRIIKYITLSEFYEKLNEEVSLLSDDFPTKSEDFFPYTDRGISYWTGFYTTRPLLKRSIKIFGQLQRAFKQIFAKMWKHRSDKYMTFFSHYMNEIYMFFDEFGNELGILLHHDAISGTSTEEVAIDYKNRLMETVQKVEFYISSIIEDYSQKIFETKNFVKILTKNSDLYKIEYKEKKVEDSIYNESDIVKSGINTICNFQKDEMCKIIAIKSNESFTIKIYNQKFETKELISIIVPEINLKIVDSSNKTVISDIICYERIDNKNKECRLYFIADLPAHEFAFYMVLLDNDKEKSQNEIEVFEPGVCKYAEIDASYKIGIHCDDEKLPGSLLVVLGKSTYKLNISYKYYTNSWSQENSGHYLFMPDTSFAYTDALDYTSDLASKDPYIATFVKGKIVSIITLNYRNLVQSQIRIINSLDKFEKNVGFEFDVETYTTPIINKGQTLLNISEENIAKDVIIEYKIDKLATNKLDQKDCHIELKISSKKHIFINEYFMLL